MRSYMDFLKSKMAIAKSTGFEIDKNELNAVLLPHQRDIVQWAIRGGRRAVFAQFGLGKTIIQLEFCKKVISHQGGKALIICPLGVKQEFAHDATEILGYLLMRTQNYVSFGGLQQELGSRDIMISEHETLEDAHAAMLAAAQSYVDMVKVGI